MFYGKICVLCLVISSIYHFSLVKSPGVTFVTTHARQIPIDCSVVSLLLRYAPSTLVHTSPLGRGPSIHREETEGPFDVDLTRSPYPKLSRFFVFSSFCKVHPSWSATTKDTPNKLHTDSP